METTENNKETVKEESITKLREFYRENISPLYNHAVKRLGPEENLEVFKGDSEYDTGGYSWESYVLTKEGLFELRRNHHNPFSKGRPSGSRVKEIFGIEKLLEGLEINNLQQIYLGLADFADRRP